MTNQTLYEGRFVNQETTRPDNENIQQEIIIRITDTETPSAHYANVHYTTTDNGDGTMTVEVTWDPTLIPGVATDTKIGTLNPLFTGVSTGLSGHAVVLLPSSYDNIAFQVITPISDLAEPLGEGEIIELEMAEVPLKISVIDNAEDKFTPFRAKQAEIQIYSSTEVSISNFAGGGDNRFKTEISIIDPSDSLSVERLQFVGWLSIADLSMEFLPDPNLITLVATDGLGFLNDEPLQTLDGENPQNEHPIMDYIVWCLAKTGLKLDIVVCMNIRERFATPLISDDSGDGHFYKYIFLDAKTFEAEIGESEDSYTVLEKILGHMAFITQAGGKWFILGVDEIETARDYYLYKFDWQGNYLENTLETFEKNIGVGLPLSWMNDDAEVGLLPEYREVALQYSFESPREVPCNIDFSRGTGDDPDDTNPSQTIDYTLDCWLFAREGSPSTGANLDQTPSVGSIGVLRKKFEYGYEKERYLVTQTAAGFRHYFRSEGIPVAQGNKITIGFSWRTPLDAGFVNFLPAHIRLVGDDGFYYDWDYDEPSGVSFWQQKTNSDAVFDNTWRQDVTDQDTSNWISVSATSQPFPTSGRLYIRLLNGVASPEIWFSGLSVENLFFTNGSFQKYTSQVHKVTSTSATTKAAINEQVFISDSPQRLFKGALLKEGGGDYVLANLFYNASLYTNADFPDETYVKPYGELQVFAVWNQNNRVMVKFEGTIDGTESSTRIPDVIDRYRMKDVDQLTENGLEQYRIFQLLHHEIDLHLCEIDGFFVEVGNTSFEKQYTGHSFKYLTQ